MRNRKTTDEQHSKDRREWAAAMALLRRLPPGERTMWIMDGRYLRSRLRRALDRFFVHGDAADLTAEEIAELRQVLQFEEPA